MSENHSSEEESQLDELEVIEYEEFINSQKSNVSS
jgi:hypothetical protein